MCLVSSQETNEQIVGTTRRLATMTQLILAGDVGGTKTWLGLFAPDGHRPSVVEARRYPTLEFDSLMTMVAHFLKESEPSGQIVATCFGVAGPVRANVSRLTNVPWLVEGDEIGRQLDIAPVRLLNDLEAMARAIPVLDSEELIVVQTGTLVVGGNAALIAPGTGLGEAGIHAVGNQLIPMPSEGGLADFAARTPREFELVAMLSAHQKRVAMEDVISGPGLINLHNFTHRSNLCLNQLPPDEPDLQPTAITTSALSGNCAACVDTLDLFVSAFGAAAGNLALRSLATAGLYIGGGIAPQILTTLRNGRFIEAFVDKGPMRMLLEQVPIMVIREQQAALVGAALAARDLT